MLRRAHRVSGGRVHDHDALPGGRILVDVVGAHPSPHDRLEPLVARERLGGDLHTTAADRPIVPGERPSEGVAGEARRHLIGDAVGCRGLEKR